MELVYNILIVIALVYGFILLSGKKMIYKYLYTYTILNIFIISGPISTIEQIPASEEIVFILFMLVVFVPVYAFGFILRRETYIIENVKKADVVRIFTEFFKNRNIQNEVRKHEIYLNDYNKYITVRGSYQVVVDFKEIMKLDFYKELKEELWLGIQRIEKRVFPFYAIFYFAMVGVLIWLKGIVT